jgi:integrase
VRFGRVAVNEPDHLEERRMSRPGQKTLRVHGNSAIVLSEANTGIPLTGDFERMAKRRFQNPKPRRHGNWWYIQVRRDQFVNGKLVRKNHWDKLAPATMPEREVAKIAVEKLRPINQGLESIGSATNFTHYVNHTYIPVVLPQKASSTQERYKGILRIYLEPAFGKLCLREITSLCIQRYFSGLAQAEVARRVRGELRRHPMSQETKDKIRDVLSSVLDSAVGYEFLVKNPVLGTKLPASKIGARKNKPFIYPGQFERLLSRIAEPYATMVYVAIYTGLRVSELAGLRWNDVHADSITIDERYCRGDWGAPKSAASNTTIGVNRAVIDRIHRLKELTVNVRAGRATRQYQVVKCQHPEDMVFQSVRDGRPIRDNNILTRHIKPAARGIGLPFVNWRCLRTSHATWLKMVGADPKDIQGQMRHSHLSTTMEIYTQFVPESQRRAVDKLSELSTMNNMVN